VRIGAKGLSGMNRTLIDAFGMFAAKPSNRLAGLSAMAADGAMVLTCSDAHFGHPSQGVLRYEDRLSRESPDSKETQLLSQHLAMARDGVVPVRMVVASWANDKHGRQSRSFHARPDLVGKVVKFDGDHFIIDFTRREQIRQVAAPRRK
jgi:hypothetical protein